MFTTPYTNPIGGNSEAVRNNLREALRLMKEAGYELRERKLDFERRQAVRKQGFGRLRGYHGLTLPNAAATRCQRVPIVASISPVAA